MTVIPPVSPTNFNSLNKDLSDTYADRTSITEFYKTDVNNNILPSDLLSETGHAILKSGNLYGWGNDSAGTLGQGLRIVRSRTPTQLNGSDFTEIAHAKESACAIRSDGTLWAWGFNPDGRLGQNDTISRSSPVQIGSDTNWTHVSNGGYHFLAIKSDGTLWSCGNNSTRGDLAQGDRIDRSSPVQVGALTNWSKTAAGDRFSLAIKTDGTLWGWGFNYNGIFGNDTVSRSSPVQIGSDTNWAEIASGSFHALAIKTNGTLWGWGFGGYGSTGHNNTIRRSSPTQIGALTNWSKVSSTYTTSIALKTDGTIWGWGRNLYGCIGINTAVPVSSPIQIGALTNWTAISSGGANHTLGLKTDGTVWAWGAGYGGKLGRGVFEYTHANFSSPIQVGTDSNWTKISAGWSSFAIKA